jgi:hypothetical protein
MASDLESLKLGFLLAHGFLDLVLLTIDRCGRVLSTLRHDE